MFLRPTPAPRKPIRTTSTLALALALIAALLSTAATTAQRAQREPFATGHAAVIAGGVATMPEGRIGWRVVEIDAQPPDEAPFAARSLGFALAEEDQVLVTYEGSGARILLDPGEATLALQDARQQRASTTDRPVSYVMLELVVAADIDNQATIGDGDLIFAGDPFRAPDGDRDLNLIRDVLDDGDTAEIAAAEAPILVYVTAGEFDVTGDDDDARLDAGEAIVLDGPIDVEAAEDDSAFVAAIIGDDVTGTDSDTERPADDAETGAFAVTTYACPDGMSIANLDQNACEESSESLVDWTLESDEFDTPGTPGIPAPETDGPTTTWTGLPGGEYEIFLTATGFAPGYDDYFIPSSNEVTRDDADTTRLFYASPGGRGAVRAYVFAASDAPEPGSVSLSVEIHTCPAGTPLESIQVEPCSEPLDGTEILLEGDPLPAPLSLRDATGDGPAPTWTGLPYGDYCLLVSNLSNGHDTIYAFGDTMPATVAATENGAAAACLTLAPGGPGRQDVYLFLVTGPQADSPADPGDPTDPDALNP